MSLSAEQLDMRLTRLGGSDAPALFGLDPYKTPEQLRAEKLAALRGQPSAFVGNRHTERGDFLEDGVARWAAHRMGLDPDLLEKPPSLEHPLLAHVLATPDRLYATPKGLIVIQVKCPSVNSCRRGWFELPAKCAAQLQWEMGLLEARGRTVSHGVLAALVNDDVKMWPVEFDLGTAMDMHAYANEWMKRLLEEA